MLMSESDVLTPDQNRTTHTFSYPDKCPNLVRLKETSPCLTDLAVLKRETCLLSLGHMHLYILHTTTISVRSFLFPFSILDIILY